MSSPAVASSSSLSSTTNQRATNERSDSSAGEAATANRAGESTAQEDGNEVEGEEEEEEEEEDDEPKLKYTRLTKSLGGVYRNGDAVSCTWVGADKMIIGTHNGNIHILSLPSLHPLRTYHAHSASITCISVSPPPPPTPTTVPTSSAHQHHSHPNSNIYIGTSSIDGHVCITPLSSLLPRATTHSNTAAAKAAQLAASKEILIKNFSRPLLAVALSPNFSADKAYLTGGLSTNLILSRNDKLGVKLTSSTVSGNGGGSGWGMGAIIPWGGDDGGKDVILSSGEGPVSTIKWSKESARYVAWGCETGIKVMRSNGFLPGEKERLVKEGGLGSGGRAEWKRICAIERPESIPEEMAGVMKARIEWVDRRELAKDEETDSDETQVAVVAENEKPGWEGGKEVLVIGWGATVWVVNVYGGADALEESRRWGWGEIVNILQTDCTISGLSLYTPSQLLLLAHLKAPPASESPSEPEASSSSSPRPRGGISSTTRTKSLSPELRLISLTTSEELCADSLMMSRYEALSSNDYHLGILPAAPKEPLPPGTTTEGGFYGFGYGSDYILGAGASLWNAGVTATTIFSSAGSVRSFGSGNGGGRSGSATPPHRGSISGLSNPFASGKRSPTIQSTAGSNGGSVGKTFWGGGGGSGSTGKAPQPPPGMSDWGNLTGRKMYISSPYDVVFAAERGIKDHLDWLLERERYEEAWDVVDKHPEIMGSSSEYEDSTGDAYEVEHRLQQHHSENESIMIDTEKDKDDSSSQSTITTSLPRPKPNPQFGLASKEKRLIGELWLSKLIKSSSWTQAGLVAGKVLDTSTRWEHWVWVFEAAGKIAEITPYIPNHVLNPPLPSVIYEIVLAHYLSHDLARFKELVLETWTPEMGLYDVGTIVDVVRRKMRSEEEELERLKAREKEALTSTASTSRSRGKRSAEKSAELTTLQSSRKQKEEVLSDLLLCLAKLYMVMKNPTDALRCYMRLKMEPEVMSLIREYHLLDAVKDHLADLLFLNITPSLLTTGTMEQIKAATLPEITLLVEEAGHGIVGPDKVISQLETVQNGGRIIMYLYLRHLFTNTHQSLIEDSYADLAVELWAAYDRPLLMEFLKGSTGYSLEKASQVCEQYNYVPELVHLLSKTGQVKRALFLIIDRLNDVSQAIAFAKQQDDPELWEDLIGYSMDKPDFIRGLLENVGTAIDPIRLVRRIPEGMVVKGLKEALGKILHEYGVQWSVCEGVANVLRGEVSRKMEELKRGQRRAVKFHVPSYPPQPDNGNDGITDEKAAADEVKPGTCASCHLPFTTTSGPKAGDTLLAFPCSHVFHLSCLLQHKKSSAAAQLNSGDSPPSTPLPLSFPDTDMGGHNQATISTGGRSVGAKVTHAALIREKILEAGAGNGSGDGEEDVVGCVVCKAKEEREDWEEGEE